MSGTDQLSVEVIRLPIKRERRIPVAPLHVIRIINDTIHMKAEQLLALRALSEYLLDNPELAFKEFKAHDACIGFLRKYCPDWRITPKAYGLETSWEAVYSQGQGGRRVVFCSEYDALPDIGHACIVPDYVKLSQVAII
jgi:hypothetical protein